jgi:hypothetical protein
MQTAGNVCTRFGSFFYCLVGCSRDILKGRVCCGACFFVFPAGGESTE